MLEKDFAVCIRKIDYSDNSQIVTLYTQGHGKLEVIAKGSKKARSPFSGPIELFSFGEIVFAPSASGKLSTLTEFDQIPKFRKLQTKYYQLNCSMFGAELLNAFVGAFDPDKELFEIFIDYLDSLQESNDEKTALRLLVQFQLRLLGSAGLCPVFDRCVNCKSKSNLKWSEVYFSSEANGLLCRDCEASFFDKVRLPGEFAEFVNALRGDVELQMAQLTHVEDLLIRHLTYMLHKAPRMSKYFLSH